MQYGSSSSQIYRGNFTIIASYVDWSKKRGLLFSSINYFNKRSQIIATHFYGLKSAQDAYKFLLAIFQFVALPVQLVITAVTNAASISQSILASIDFEKTMKRTAYGYQISKELDEYSAGRRSLNYVSRSTQLYSDHSNSINPDIIRRCLGENHNISMLPYCMKMNKAQTVALSKMIKSELEDSLSKCQKKQSFLGARNPFNLKTKTYYLCEINDTELPN